MKEVEKRERAREREEGAVRNQDDEERLNLQLAGQGGVI